MEPSKNPFPMDHWAQQSPIKLCQDESLFVSFAKSFLSIDYSGAPFAGTFEGEPGHKNFVLSKLQSDQSPPLVKLGGVTARLVKIHLHTPSEHFLDGEQKRGEIHLLHEIEHPTSGSQLLVLGVFFEKVDDPDKCVKSDFFQVWAEQLQAAATRSDSSHAPTVEIDPRLLLPIKKKKWYRYEGSLTSAPFSETVSWLIFTKSLGIQSKDLELLEKYAHQPDRPTQDINRRFLLRSFE